MADHLTEEEQVEAFKSWWKENWLSVILPVVVVAGGVIFWNNYQDRQVANREAASDKFAEILKLTGAEQSLQGFGGAEISEEDKASAREKADKLIADHEGTRYALLARMMQAKFDVEAKNYAAAAGHLRAVADNDEDPALAQLAEYRLARVLFAEQKFAEAQALVDDYSEGEFGAAYAELEGDILLAQGKTLEANGAYKRALEKLSPQQFARRGIINMKAENTAVAASPATSADAQAPVVEKAAPEASSRDENSASEPADSKENAG